MTFTKTPKMPVLFVGHGSPMNAIEDNEFSRTWSTVGKALSMSQTILCISAHWETTGTFVTAMDRPETIHDFYGFPQELSEMLYPAPGAPHFARQTKQIVHRADVHLTDEWGLDHGTWSVLCRMYPDANVPTYQLSLDRTQTASYHYALAQELSPLREQGVLIVGSGNVVHNLRMARFDGTAYDWAIAFDDWVKQRLLDRDHQALTDYHLVGQMGHLAVPTPEHYLPLLYAIALQTKDESITFFNEKVVYGTISMRGLTIH
ncbi:MAG: 4,5-DOPA dioxygenase extradiol [Anaerolineae bacterium]|nr:4,5-DOPA dioxygenase extradiol [Anaerolineae bacterium]